MLNFPDSPTLNQVFTATGKSWSWDGTKWIVSGAATATIITYNGTSTLTTGFTGFVRIENNTSAPITITLPLTPTASQTITLKDTSGNAGTWAITIAGNGKTIEGTTTKIINISYGWLALIYTGIEWGQT